MKYNDIIPKIIISIAIFSMLLCFFILDEISLTPNFNLSAYLFSFSFILIYSYYYCSRNITSFLFYSLLMTPYLTINISYMVTANESFDKISILVTFGLFTFFLLYNTLINRKPIVNFSAYAILVNETTLLKWFFIFLIFLFSLKLLSFYPELSLIYKALKLSLGNVFLVVLYGLFFCITSLSHSVWTIIISIISLLLLIISNNSNINDYSLFSFLQLFFVLLLSMYYRVCRSLVLSQMLRNLILIFITTFNCYLFFKGFTFGGDSLILHGASEVVKYVDDSNQTQPFMPLFNAIGIIIPDSVWSLFYDKPKAFNSSAFYIQNIMGLSPESYPWGVGVSSFGAAYIYGGYIGVFLLFSLFAILFANLYNRARDPFSCGVVIYMNLLLVFAMIRMDETFILGSWLISLPVLFFFLSYFRKVLFRNTGCLSD